MTDNLPQSAAEAGNVDASQQAPGTEKSAIASESKQESCPSQTQQRQLRTEHSSSQSAFSSQMNLTPSHPVAYSRHGMYSMTPLASALPTVGFRHGQYHQPGVQQRYHPAPTPAMIPSMPPVAQYAGHSAMPIANQGYYVQQAHHLPPYFGPTPISPSQPAIPSTQNHPYYSNSIPMGHSSATYYYPTPSPQYQGQPQNIASNMIPTPYATGSIPTPEHQPSIPSADLFSFSLQRQHQHQYQRPNRDSRSTVRGPPRKPRHDGNAVWIGNLPPQTDLMNLVLHVCKETEGLESLFLISKSNCAFANYKDEQACKAAQKRLHESKFHSIRLVCRPRKNNAEATAAAASTSGNTVTTAIAEEVAVPGTEVPEGTADDGELETESPVISSTTGSQVVSSTPNLVVPPPIVGQGSGPNQPQKQSSTPTAEASQSDRFFILKSLTVDDLELSVRTGIWATQSHNEEALSKAYETCENVYLVFSANKSGEYFGYAKMVSKVNEDLSAVIQFTPTTQTSGDLDSTNEVIIEATDDVPRGRIIDDSSRGTIFWEVAREDEDSGTEDEDTEALSNKGTASVAEEDERTWGKPFKVKWLSTSRLPFTRTRNLRNPWNSNREVKIARDGTELEPSVGRKLIGLFNRPQNPRQLTGVQPLGPPTGYQPMPPYGQ